MSTEWKQVKERGNYLSIWLIVFAYRIGGKFLVAPILYCVVFYFYLTRSSTRRHSQSYISRISNYLDAKQAKELSSWKHYMSFAGSLLDKVAIWLDNKEFKHISLPNRERMLAACKEGPGAVVLTAHLGNFELCRALASDGSGIRVNIVIDTKHTESFSKLIEQLSPGSNVNLISTHDINPATAIDIQSRLDNGECLVIMADRVAAGTEQRTLPATLLGGDIVLPEGPFRIALSLERPLFFMACVKLDNEHFRVELNPIEFDTKGLRKKAKMNALAQAYIQQLESLCKTYPLQWFNFYDYWCEDKHSQNTQQNK